MSTPANPGSITHQINGLELWLEADGTLQVLPLAIERTDELKLCPGDVWALATFFKAAGVRALINRCELARQHARHVAEEASDGA